MDTSLYSLPAHRHVKGVVSTGCYLHPPKGRPLLPDNNVRRNAPCFSHHLPFSLLPPFFSLPPLLLCFRPVAYQDPTNWCLMLLFAQMLKDAVNEYAYNAEIAGISYNIAVSVYGIKVGREGRWEGGRRKEGEQGREESCST